MHLTVKWKNAEHEVEYEKSGIMLDIRMIHDSVGAVCVDTSGRIFLVHPTLVRVMWDKDSVGAIITALGKNAESKETAKQKKERLAAEEAAKKGASE